MMTWLASHIGTIAVSAVLCAVVAGILVKMIRDKKSGRSSCGGNCGSCGHCSGGCHKH